MEDDKNACKFSNIAGERNKPCLFQQHILYFALTDKDSLMEESSGCAAVVSKNRQGLKNRGQKTDTRLKSCVNHDKMNISLPIITLNSRKSETYKGI